VRLVGGLFGERVQGHDRCDACLDGRNAGHRFALLVEMESSLLKEPRWAEVERTAGIVLMRSSLHATR
jgi:hypothetical protein